MTIPRSRVTAPLVNHYDVLQVTPAASTEQIRKNFKRLVLEAHPDKNPNRQEWSERRIRELIEAFEVVGNADTRAEFDRLLGVLRPRVKRHEEPFFFRKTDPESRALLILHHLLKGRAESATSLLAQMEERLGARFLAENLDRADYLDCLFLLGEHYTESRNFRQAERRLRAFYDHECEARFPRHYMDEVVRRLKELYLKKFPRFATPEEAVEGLAAVQAMGLTKAEELLRLRALAELELELGRVVAARRAVDRARRLDPKGRSLEKVEKKLERAERAKG